jgi:hypothetical protein
MPFNTTPRLDDLANLSTYAKHLVSVEDRDRVAHYSGLLYLTVIYTFQQASITNFQWSPNLILKIGSRERIQGKCVSSSLVFKEGDMEFTNIYWRLT